MITPSMSATSVEKRGFHVKNPAAVEKLEMPGRTFMVGYACAAEASTPAEAAKLIEQRLPKQYWGFAYEGAGMGYGIRDGLPLGGSRHVAGFLEEQLRAAKASGQPFGHVYMAYVGVGWAMARLPRFRWKPLDAAMTDPVIKWLALDGYGFHQAYFKTDKYVHEHYREPNFPWPSKDLSWYADRVLDQGIGRAMWFVGGADPDRVADLIEKFPESRHADLFAGTGLAATYAGSADEDELWTLLRRAGDHGAHLAQGCAFAATARVETGLTTEHTRLATKVLAGVTPEQAAKVVAEARPADNAGGDVPPYELWRQGIGAGLSTLQGANP